MVSLQTQHSISGRRQIKLFTDGITLTDDWIVGVITPAFELIKQKLASRLNHRKCEMLDMKFLKFWLFFLIQRCAFGITTISTAAIMHFITPLIAEPKDELRNFGLMVGTAAFVVQFSWELFGHLIQQRVRLKARAQKSADIERKKREQTGHPLL